MFNPPYEASTWIPYLEIVLEFIRAIAWPVAAIIGASIFSKELKSLLPRIRKIGPTGFELDTAFQNDFGPNDMPERVVSNTLGNLNDPVAATIEARNLADLKSVPDAHKEAVLLRALTTQELFKYFALAYSNIFSSQIGVLEILNTRKVDNSDAKEMFRKLQDEKEPLRELTLEKYLNFLFIWKFIKHEEGAYEITETGRNFLSFIVTTGLSKDRGFL
jgi:hypothetical protein